MQAKSLAVSVGCRRGAMQLQGKVDNAAMVLASYRTLLGPSRLKAAVHRHSRRLAAWLCVLGGIHFLGSRERLLFGLRTVNQLHWVLACVSLPALLPLRTPQSLRFEPRAAAQGCHVTSRPLEG